MGPVFTTLSDQGCGEADRAEAFMPLSRHLSERLSRKRIDGARAPLAIQRSGDQLGRSALTQSVFDQDVDQPKLHEELCAGRIDLGNMTLIRLSRADRACSGLDEAEDTLILLLVRTGVCRVVQGNELLSLDSAEAMFLDGRVPYSCEMAEGEGCLLAVSRSKHRAAMPECGGRLPRRIPASDPGLRLIATYLQSDLINEAITPTAVAVVASHLRDLFTISLRTALAIELSRPTVTVIKRDIRANLARHSLSAEVVAQWYGLSLRSLQRIFARSGGTMSSFILDERLQLVRQRLKLASDDHRIDVIARECGFHSLSHFNTAFRRKFGAAPSTIRAVDRANRE